MARISEQTIEKVRSSSDIIEVIQGYVQIKQKGRNFFGLCPFHNEKTPSFSVNPDRQIFKCFGCGLGGGVINFIMEIEKLEFKDSIIFLAEHAGVEIELNESYGTSNDIASDLIRIHEQASKIFVENLNSSKGEQIYSQLLKRGLTKETIEMFDVGYGTDSNKQLLKFFQNQKYSSSALQKSGLFIDTKYGYIDRFKSRIIFPIHNPTGKIIGFSGRVVNNDKFAKYVNSPETPIYHKSNILYGLHQSKKYIRESNSVIVVEGYFDYLQLFQSGIGNVVAISGTAFTDKHAQLLRRYTNNIYLAYDGDSAGVSAAIKAGYILLKHGHNPKILNMPKDVDPDDWICKDGTKPFKEAIKQSSDIIPFHIKNCQFDLKTEAGRFNFIEESLAEISQIPDAVYRELQIQSLASITNVSENSIYEKLNSIITNKERYKQKKTSDNTNIEEPSINLLQEELIKLCFAKKIEVRILIFENLNKSWITTTLVEDLYDTVYIHLKSNHPPNPSIILNEIKDSNERSFLSGILFDLDNINLSVKMAKECLIRLEKHFLQTKLEALRTTLKSQSLEQVNAIMSEISAIDDSLKKLTLKYEHIKEV